MARMLKIRLEGNTVSVADCQSMLVPPDYICFQHRGVRTVQFQFHPDVHSSFLLFIFHFCQIQLSYLLATLDM